jgi:hypothetical protein
LSTAVAVARRAASGDDLSDARRDGLVRAIAEDLKTQTYAQAMVADIEDEDEWRTAARIAEHEYPLDGSGDEERSMQTGRRGHESADHSTERECTPRYIRKVSWSR